MWRCQKVFLPEALQPKQICRVGALARGCCQVAEQTLEPSLASHLQAQHLQQECTIASDIMSSRFCHVSTVVGKVQAPSRAVASCASSSPLLLLAWPALLLACPATDGVFFSAVHA